MIGGYGMVLWQGLAALYAKTGSREAGRARFESDALHQLRHHNQT